jgi:teichuronic acid biosynthesis glycosyltransferase TuaG
MKKDLTILICVHSKTDLHDSLLLKSIESLEKQTYKNFDVLIVLDECWDKTKKLIIEENYNLNIKFLVREKKEGLAFAKNFALGEIKTTWVGFLDADDLYLPEKLEKQMSYIDENYVDFLGTLAWNIQGLDESNIFPSCFPEGMYVSHEDIKNTIFNQNILTHGSMLIKRECLESLGGYQHKRGWEDWDLWQRAINKEYKFYQLQERLYIYRIGTSTIR